MEASQVEGKWEARYRRLKTLLEAARLAGVLGLAGAILIFVSNLLQDGEPPNWWQASMTELGALLLIGGAVSFLWDLRGRRLLVEEMASVANLSAEVHAAGLTHIRMNYHDVHWKELLAAASHVDLFFAYAQTWRNTHASSLRQLVSRDGTRLRVVLPDLDDEGLMERLAAKFEITSGELEAKVRDAVSDVENLYRQAATGASVQLHLTTEFPVFTYYRFDGTCVGVLYSQAPGRTQVPAFESSQGGTLNAFFRGQFEALWDSGSVRALTDDEDGDGDGSS